MGENLTAEQKQQAEALLEEFSDVFTDVPGRTHLIENNFTTTNEKPIRQKAHRLPQALQETVKKETDQMLAQGTIKPSKSPWAFPLVLVPKKDMKSVCLCVDYRDTVFDAYPMPRMDEILERKGKANLISCLDLTKGYWQVPLSKSARDITAFILPFWLFEYLVMPFGMRTAPATVMRLMDK